MVPLCGRGRQGQQQIRIKIVVLLIYYGSTECDRNALLSSSSSHTDAKQKKEKVSYLYYK
jgi:hypothetical protein